MKDLDNLFEPSLVESFAALPKGFGESDGRVLHPFVGFLRAANQEEMFAAGQTGVAVLVVESHAQKADYL